MERRVSLDDNDSVDSFAKKTPLHLKCEMDLKEGVKCDDCVCS